MPRVSILLALAGAAGAADHLDLFRAAVRAVPAAASAPARLAPRVECHESTSFSLGFLSWSSGSCARESWSPGCHDSYHGFDPSPRPCRIADPPELRLGAGERPDGEPAIDGFASVEVGAHDGVT